MISCEAPLIQLTLILSGGIGRLTPLLCENVIVWAKKEGLAELGNTWRILLIAVMLQRKRNSPHVSSVSWLPTGGVPFQSKLKGLVKTEELKLVKEKDAIKFSRHGYKSRDDLEA